MKKQVIVFVLVVACLHAISFSQTKNSATEWFKRAESRYERKHYQGAIADYTKAIDLRPDFAEAYYGRGRLKARLEDYQGAIADYTKVISLAPVPILTGVAYYERGRAYLFLNQKDTALVDFKRAIQLGEQVPQDVLDMSK